MAELNTEAQQALTAAKLGGLKKKLNAESWNENMEDLMKMWGEKAAGLRFMHSNAAGSWKGFSNSLTLWSIGITTLASGASLVAASIDDDEAKNAVLYVVGGIGIISSLIQSLKKFYNAEEKSADHAAIAKQFGSFYRYMTLQMTLTREDRLPSDQLAEYALKEYERLQQEAPPLGGAQVALYKNTFSKSPQATPDVCEDEFLINVYKPPDVVSIPIKDDEIEILNKRSSSINMVSTTSNNNLNSEINSDSSDDLPIPRNTCD
jgi:hypothetical protein